MKTVICDYNEQFKAKNIYRCGDFVYEMIPDFGKWPEKDQEFIFIASGCCDKDDNVYAFLRDPAGIWVAVFDDEGNFIRKIDASFMKGLHFGTFTKDDTLILMDIGDHCAYELTKDGKKIREFGTPGKPSDTGRDDGYWRRERRYGKTYPTEIECFFTSEKWEFFEAAKRITRRGEPFNKPTSVCIGNHGEIYFGDGYGNCAVHKFLADGTLVSSWGEPVCNGDGAIRPGPGRFLMVHGIRVDSKDRIWANDRENNAVNVFDPEGNVVAYLTGNLGQPSDLWYDGTYMYVVGRGGYITIFNDDFEIVGQLGYFNSDLKAHGVGGNSKGDLYLFPTKANPDHQIIKLKRIK